MLKNIFKDIDQLSELTSLTHFRISKLDLEQSDSDIKNTFGKTIAVEAINIAYNWSLSCLRQLLFNEDYHHILHPIILPKS